MADSNKGLRILIVEDSPGDQYLVTELLELSVIKIKSLHIAETLLTAIDFLNKDAFDIILLDLSLPDSSGIDTFKTLKKFSDKTPVIILSGLTDTNLAVEAITLGAQDYHIKGELNANLLTKTILYSIERKRNLEVLLENNERYITLSKAELDLLQSEQSARQIMNGSPDAIICIDTYGKIIVWNPQAEKIFGWKQHEILGKPLTETIIPVQYREHHERGMKYFQSTGEGPIMNKLIEITAINQAEQEFPIELTVIPLIENGNQFFCAFVRDISERKTVGKAIMESETKYRAFFENSLDGILLTNAEGKISAANPAACGIFGRTEEEICLAGRDLLIDTSDIRLISIFEERRLKGKVKGELICIQKNGAKTPIEISSAVFKDAQGEEKICVIVRDITERKKIEEEIRQSNSRFEMIALATNDAVWDWDLETGKLWGNHVHQHLYGLTTSDPVASEREWTERIHPDDRERTIQSRAESLLSDKNVFTSEYRFLTKENSYQDVYDRCYIVRNKEGQPIRRMGSMMDITERKLAEEQLNKSNKKYASLVNTIDGIVWEADAQSFEFNFVSQQAERLLGYPVKMWINSPTFWADHIHPDDRKQAVDFCVKSTRNKKSHEFEYRMIAADGSTVWLRDIVTVIVEDDIPVKLRGVMIDITQKREADEAILKTNARFQVMSKATSDIIWDRNMSDESIWWNDNYYSLLGIKKLKEIASINDWYDRIHPDDLSRVKKEVENGLRGSETFWTYEYRFAKADGSYLHFLDRTFVMRNMDGQAYRMIGSMVNMTPMHEAQRVVAESENRLRTIFETEPECIKLLSRKNELLDMNPAGLAMIEADSLEEVKGKSILGIVAAKFKKSFAKLTQDVFEGKPGTMEFEIIGLKGTHRFMETHAVPFKNTNGEIISLLGVTRDVTEKKKIEIEIKQNEEKYKTLVEQAIDAIALYDETGKVLDVNTGSVNLLGYTKEELIGMSLKEILTEEEIVLNPVRYDILQKGKSTIKQRRMRRKDSSIVETEVRSQRLPDGRFLSVIRDLTERIEAERELTESYEAIRNLTAHIQNIREEERTSIAREIHDELGQQLTVLKMDVSWLRKKMGVSDEVVKHKFIDLIAMLDETVNTVRRISSELRPSLLDDLGLVAAMEWQLGEFEKRSGLNASFIHSGEDLQLPDLIRTALFRIFQESLTNVARHADADLVTVTITKKNDKLVLSIADNGKGFDKQKVSEKKTLGILGMKERVLMIGGEYEIKSNLGQGTEVFVQIPLKENIN